MKTRILISALLALSAARAEARSELLDYNGTFFQVLIQGHSLKVAPSLVSVHPTPQSAEGLDCAAVHAAVQAKAWLMDECVGENPPESLCKSLGDRLRLVAEGRLDTTIPIDRSVMQAWQLGAPTLAGVDVAGVRAAVAAKYGVPESAVEPVAGGARPRVTSSNVYVPKEGSEYQKISKFVAFDLGDVASFTNDGRLVTRNKVFACDLLEGKVLVQTNATSSVRSVDHVPDEVVDTAWAAYKALETAAPEIDGEASAFVKGALVGFHLGKAVARVRSGDELLKPASLVRRLFAFDGGSPRLLPRSSRDELRERTYPDATLEEPLTQAWRIQ